MSVATTIRPFRPGDAGALAALFHAAVRQGALGDYRPEQVVAWSPSPPDPAAFAARAIDGRLVLVAVDARDRPLAYGDLEPSGHIDHLYCRPDMIGRGVASAIYDRLEAAARGRGLVRLFVEASEAARRLFAAKGFVALERRDFMLRGVTIHNYRMEKSLADDDGATKGGVLRGDG
ncbi:GNAT family N-acetyltransferase [Caulobacter sp. CCUG 60055]|uniref:GNAT family N-acetyltransferase n=1 Tax=Caulobacter sp. CCUG 60055 TaxID=2100090 RepID=UPI001FA7D3E3|nr:GNAT family N-acetyltransferase [Caulobacter sp. CCUG 60055]MBQ1541947.1 GNAT family N-acetyltransferase [Caulobacteraceae bacterium]MCI3180339.1 GNAT family N-acetyltransferase [Caulobacter sp. CCUG 60055]